MARSDFPGSLPVSLTGGGFRDYHSSVADPLPRNASPKRVPRHWHDHGSQDRCIARRHSAIWVGFPRAGGGLKMALWHELLYLRLQGRQSAYAPAHVSWSDRRRCVFWLYHASCTTYHLAISSSDAGPILASKSRRVLVTRAVVAGSVS